MSEENSNAGVDNMEAAAPLDSVTSESAPEQDSPVAKQVPLEALESERSKRQRLEEENQMMREHYALLQSQMAPQSSSQKEESEGYDENDVMTYGEFKKLSSKMANQFQMTIAELKMTQKHPDYQEVITNYLPDVIKQNPSLKDSLNKTQDYELAYYLAKNSDAYKQATTSQKKSEEAERILKNTQRAGSLSSMGGSTPVSQAKRYKDMSEEEFRKVMHQNLGY